MNTTSSLSETQRTEFARRISEFDTAQPGFAGAWELMSQRLMAFGGRGVVPQDESLAMLERLGRAAEIEQPRSVRVDEMEPNQCHRNSLMCWARSLGAEKVWYGYALSTDGLWRQHSWVRDDRGIIDTTALRVAYFGLERSFESCAKLLALEINPLDAPMEFQQSDFWREVTEVLLAVARNAD